MHDVSPLHLHLHLPRQSDVLAPCAQAFDSNENGQRVFFEYVGQSYSYFLAGDDGACAQLDDDLVQMFHDRDQDALRETARLEAVRLCIPSQPGSRPPTLEPFASPPPWPLSTSRILRRIHRRALRRLWSALDLPSTVSTRNDLLSVLFVGWDRNQAPISSAVSCAVLDSEACRHGLQVENASMYRKHRCISRCSMMCSCDLLEGGRTRTCSCDNGCVGAVAASSTLE